jgi:hypothetical protein
MVESSSNEITLVPEALFDKASLLARLYGSDPTVTIASVDNAYTQTLNSYTTLSAGRSDFYVRLYYAAFLAQFGGARTIIVEDGLWMRHLRAWLPKPRLTGLGEFLSSLAAVRRGLRKTDLYVIESRTYHGDYERLVKHYDRLRTECGCTFNLDLQRVAIPAEGQAGWILKGRKVNRIVVERMEDGAAFESLGGYPVVHVAELADH